MMSFEEWLLKKQKMNLNWFNTMIPDKRVYRREWHRYKETAQEFDNKVSNYDKCSELAHELVMLEH